MKYWFLTLLTWQSIASSQAQCIASIDTQPLSSIINDTLITQNQNLCAYIEISNTGALINNNSIYADFGSITNNGTIVNNGTTIIGRLSIVNNNEMHNSGNIKSYGDGETIINNGRLSNTGLIKNSIHNSGIINNSGSINPVSITNKGTINILNEGSIAYTSHYQDSSQFRHQLENSGVINIDGSITTEYYTIVTNTGKINNRNILQVTNSNLNNLGNIANSGTLIIETTPDTTSSTLINTGVISGSGNIELGGNVWYGSTSIENYNVIKQSTIKMVRSTHDLRGGSIINHGDISADITTSDRGELTLYRGSTIHGNASIVDSELWLTEIDSESMALPFSAILIYPTPRST